MTTRVVERIGDWDQLSFSGGYAGLQELAQRDFSGAVRAGGAELHMTKGVVVGIRGGTMGAFEGTRGTALQAPSPALPLLAVMQEQSETVRDSFYSEQTSIAEVDQTLSSGGFTGYIELSENVLSGDYYLVYHGGESMSVAFVGQSERLIDGEDAFETADDEVGIYEVRPVDIDPIEIPDPPTASGDTGSTGQSTSTASASGGRSTGATDRQGGGQQPSGQAGSTTKPGHTRAASTGDTGGATRSGTAGGARTSGASEGAPSSGDSRSEQAIPSLDPARTTLPGEEGTQQSSTPSSAARSGTATDSPRTSAAGGDGSATDGVSSEVKELRQEYESLRESHRELREQYEALQESHEQVEQEASALRDELAEVKEEREELRDELAEVKDEREELREELAEHGADGEEARTENAGKGEEARTENAADADEGTAENAADAEGVDGAEGESVEMTERDPTAALAETTLLVRYDSKGGATLADTADSSVTREDVRSNLRLESYTPFEADSTLVDGEPYDSFLEESVGYQFVEWALAELPFEIDETDNSEKLAPLFDALPAVDRTEFSETVQVEGGDEAERPEFDVVLRDGHGNPLLVVSIDDAGSPTTADTTTEFVEAGTAVGDSYDSLAGAIIVTRSYFEGGARDFAEDVSTGGLSGQSDRANFVSTGSTDGYHLCLAEARDERFHLILPDL